MTTEYEKAVDAQEPAVWVAADTLNSPHPACVSSLAYMSQLDRERGREYVPLYAAPVAAQGEDDAWCAECGVKLELVRPGKHQHPTCSQAAPTEAEVEAAAKRAAAANSSIPEGYDLELFWRLLDERAQTHWLKVARAALGVEGGDDGRG